MDQSEQQFLEGIEQENQKLKTQNNQLQREYGQVSMFSGDKAESLIEWQLDLQKELLKIDNLLRGRHIKRDNQGNESWMEADRIRSKILSDTGVEGLMTEISLIINKNTILSNFSQDEINWKMKDFLDTLNDDIFMNYNNIFYKPSIEELIHEDIKIVESIQSKYKIVIDADGNITNENSSLSGKLKTILNEQIERKIEQIKSKTEKDYLDEAEEIYTNNKKKYPMIIELMKIAVHSTLLRALNGGERETLRKIVHVSESKSAMTSQPYKSPQTTGSKWNPLSWVKA